jgi:Glu-tRNA(Gln) amidotransferase subunit E-like FAD-binding protein
MNFATWIKENAQMTQQVPAAPQTAPAAPQMAPQVAQGPMNQQVPQAPMQANNQIQDEPIKKMLKTRLQQVFQELAKSNIPASRAVNLLSLVIQEFKNELGLKDNQTAKALRMSRGPIPAA